MFKGEFIWVVVVGCGMGGVFSLFYLMVNVFVAWYDMQYGFASDVGLCANVYEVVCF